MEPIITILAFVGLALMAWDCLEVGRNDAANLVNAVFGSRILTRTMAVALAGVAVVAGATAAAPVMETARSGIFNPAMLTLKAAMIAYISVYLVDTVLLYSYSAFGMPVSTTACLIFELVGASIGLAGFGIVHWGKVGEVIAAIFVSIAMAGLAGFLVQRVFRGAIRDRYRDHETILLHGPWMAGLMLTWLSWFMVLKGMKQIELVETLRKEWIEVYGAPLMLLLAWGGFTLAVHLLLTLTGQRGTRQLFHVTAVIGMVCMAFAFGQNDLANCAAPGVAAFWLWLHPEETVGSATKIPISTWVLFVAGLLIALGMTTRNAQRVTRAQANTGSQFDRVALYAPEWCQAIARWFVGKQEVDHGLAPPPMLTAEGKKIHFDAMRASVIMAIGASVIALASSRGLPVSTTYVSFAAVIATGLADRVMARGDAHLKIGRAIWVVTSWFIAAVIAVVATALVARTIYHLETAGIVLAVAANLGVRHFAKRRADAQEQRVHGRIGGKDLDYHDDSEPGDAAPPVAGDAHDGPAEE